MWMSRRKGQPRLKNSRPLSALRGERGKGELFYAKQRPVFTETTYLSY